MEKSKVGRPVTPDYYKYRFRYSAIEKTFQEIADQLTDNDREAVKRFLNELKAKAM